MQANNGSVADLLAFESWPEEHQRIARVAVTHEDAHESLIEDALRDGRGEMVDEAAKEYRGIVSAHRIIQNAVDEMRRDTANGLVVTERRLDDLLKLIEDLPDELAIDADT